MGIATGEAKLRDGDYFGAVLNRAARVMAAGHGGQIHSGCFTPPDATTPNPPTGSATPRTCSSTRSASPPTPSRPTAENRRSSHGPQVRWAHIGIGAGTRCGILSGVSVDGESAAHEELARCLLRSYPTVAARVFDIRNGEPRLAIVVGKEAIWVIDPNTNALVASAWLAQVTATPAKRVDKVWGVAAESWRTRTVTVPALVVGVPGLQPLTIGCLEPPKNLWVPVRFRFSWRGEVQREDDVAYWVTGVDWLTLVETVGLAARLTDTNEKRVKGYPWRSATGDPQHPDN